jgi:hypothetical protein
MIVLKLDRKKLLDLLVEQVRTLERVSVEAERLRLEIEHLSGRLKSVYGDILFMRKMKQRHSLQRSDIIRYRKKLLRQLLQTRKKISQTKRALWSSQ